MTRLNLLEDQKAILEAKKEVLENKRGDIYVREQQAISDTLLPFFTGFSPDAYIEVQRGSVYFKMDHPDYSYKKELFNLYLREDWRFDEKENKKSYTGIDLSYYTTSTKGVDAWELKRLRMLGDLAEIVLKKHDEIVDAVNNVVFPFKVEYREVYAEMNEIGKEIRGVERMITLLEKERIEWDLKDEGVNFEKGRNIQLKFNYSPNVINIKLTELSKSGKKGTAVFTFAHGGSESREENVNVSSIIDQVHGLRDNIVQHTLAE
ncbi:hypothetical protein immuto35A_135 [Flavobacterium phage vB_FspM_immuto_3-5A]|uniref:Uncharacterized protein n=1 Tax=Flavobacterium phage vB_FspM_immuto_2-6A TaxID=2801477 RepID=A0A7T8IWM8_9CAUD|nr:hypothetical protein KNV73_gp135 [Flavobacterium phage vB_FspM_immuto_2-6A]QQO91815.1 hypothetical protein immuto26A_136 [Flavobacterium phage vB_FspM_immuto_2-6A]QQO92053.1 hypothetical protein immuto35A_135 [Flavobacterium phage vB_FspM_immuto_3-5A]QQO92291.1 hypothetical protein immuto136C_135 [Flavobacterium phage vB_FspM_immuto_13-6C]